MEGNLVLGVRRSITLHVLLRTRIRGIRSSFLFLSVRQRANEGDNSHRPRQKWSWLHRIKNFQCRAWSAIIDHAILHYTDEVDKWLTRCYLLQMRSNNGFQGWWEDENGSSPPLSWGVQGVAFRGCIVYRGHAGGQTPRCDHEMFELYMKYGTKDLSMTLPPTIECSHDTVPAWFRDRLETFGVEAWKQWACASNAHCRAQCVEANRSTQRAGCHMSSGNPAAISRSKKFAYVEGSIDADLD